MAYWQLLDYTRGACGAEDANKDYLVVENCSYVRYKQFKNIFEIFGFGATRPAKGHVAPKPKISKFMIKIRLTNEFWSLDKMSIYEYEITLGQGVTFDIGFTNEL